MRRLPLLALLTIVGGLALLAYAAATGQGQVALVVIFPVFTGTGLVSFAGMLLIMLGFFLGFLSLAGRPPPTERIPPGSPEPATPTAPVTPAKRFGGVVFLGPFPIVFGSDRRISTVMLVLGVLLTILLLVFFFLPRTPP